MLQNLYHLHHHLHHEVVWTHAVGAAVIFDASSDQHVSWISASVSISFSVSFWVRHSGHRPKQRVSHRHDPGIYALGLYLEHFSISDPVQSSPFGENASLSASD
tara:strand:+ start:429 stop:740 length:312 start_codon:yes stop_codon:yes gene_type:complete